MKIKEVDRAIAICQKHLKDSKSEGTIIESYLTRYLLILIIAQFENQIYQIIKTNVQCKTGGQKINNYFEGRMKRDYKGVKASDLAKYLASYGTQCQDSFKKKINQDKHQRAVTFYNNLITNRHDTAHKEGSQISFRDLVNFYNEGHIVLDLLESSIK
jgi:hypothetical protein